jgi:hypothetical protein
MEAPHKSYFGLVPPVKQRKADKGPEVIAQQFATEMAGRYSIGMTGDETAKLTCFAGLCRAAIGS